MAFVMYETDPAGLEQFYRSVVKSFETYAPVESFKGYTFEKVTEASKYKLHPPVGACLSVKDLFFPQTTQVMKFKETSAGIEVLPSPEDPMTRKKVALGVKMCDAQGMKVLEGVMKWDFIDEDFLKRRDSTVLVVDMCDSAEPFCFCTSLDFDFQKSDAFDVLVVGGRGKTVILEARTARGDEFLRAAGKGLKPATDAAEKVISEQFKAFQDTFKTRKGDYSAINKAMKDNFDSPLYDEASRGCVSCKTCAFVCPTCHCFKTSDEKVKDIGIRYKCADTCLDCNFTRMAGGHNPRTEKATRWRQRTQHKFVYYKERFGSNLCVGCGRCVASCPAHIDIFEFVMNMVKNGGKK